MKKNLFKDKKILFLIPNDWFDGTNYKLPEFLKKEFGIDSTKGEIEGDIDLGICKGDKHILYKKFLEKNISYILVEHDCYSLRFGLNERTYPHDKEKIENAVAVIFISEDHLEYYKMLKEKYRWHIPQHIVVHNRPLRKDISFKPKMKLEGLNLVYAGGIVAPKEKRLYPYNYKVFYYIFEKFIEAGWNVHIYPCKNNNTNRMTKYRNIGCIIHDWIPGNKIYEEMSQYTAGFQGYNNIDTPPNAWKYAQTSRPNKIYDYLASGIPTIGYQGGNGMEIYKDKWGIIIDDLEPETLKAIPERLKKIKITKKMRNENVLEKKERDKYEYIIKIALEEAENKNRKRYYITENPFKIEDTTKYPKNIKVTNKGAITIYRGGYLFLPGKTSEELTVNMRTYKEIKSHVSLRIEHIK